MGDRSFRGGGGGEICSMNDFSTFIELRDMIMRVLARLPYFYTLCIRYKDMF